MLRVRQPGHRGTDLTHRPELKGSSLLGCIPRVKGMAGAGATQGTFVSKDMQQERQGAAESSWSTQRISAE